MPEASSVSFDPDSMKKTLRRLGLTELQVKEVVSLLARNDYRVRAPDLIALLERLGFSSSRIIGFLTEIGMGKGDAVSSLSAAHIKKLGSDAQRLVYLEVVD
jgi:NACalpha-BTF3-like transcription factor